MADERKRIIEQTASTEIFNDDWFIKDSALHNTTKISQSVLKQEILKDVKGVVELTQAEYDALPSSKLTDGILYAIKDSEDIIGNIENAIDTLSGDTEDSIDKILSSIAPEWSPTFTYGYDAYVIYEGELWRCFKDTGSTVGEFKTSEWIKAVTSGYITHVIDKIADRFVASNPPYMTYRYSVGDMVFYAEPYHDEQLYVCNTDLPQGESTFNPEHWDVVYTVAGLSKYLMDKIAEAGQIDDVQVKTTGDYESVVDENKVAKIDLSNMLIEKSVPNLPQQIASFSDGSDNPLKSLTASIEPVQDLHGYDSPWAGGAGKNKLASPAVQTITENTMTCSIANGIYTFSGTPTGGSFNKTIAITSAYVIKSTDYFYFFNSVASNGVIIYVNFTDNTNAPITLSAQNSKMSLADHVGKTVASIRFYIGTGATYNATIKAMIANGSAETEWQPYSNICPISGWTEANVTRCGKNLFGGEKLADVIVSKVTYATKNTTNKTVSYSANRVNNIILFENFKSNTQYTIIANMDSGATNLKINYSDGTKQSIQSNAVTVSTAGKTVVALSGEWQTGDSVLLYEQFGIFEGVITAQDFEPYAGNTYTIPFVDGQGQSHTSWGGTFDVTGGQLDDNKTSIIIDGVNVKARSKTDYGVNTRFVISYPSGKTGNYSGERTYGLCDKIKVSYIGTISIRSDIEYGMVILPYTTDIFLTMPTREISTVDQMNEWLQSNNVQLVYELATPVTYPQQPTSINSLEGDNNLSASTGQITKLEYIANATDVIANLEARVTALENQ